MLTAGQVDQYRQDGYTIFRRLVDAAAMAEMTSYIDRFIERRAATSRPEHLDKPHVEDRRFLEFCAHPRILDAVADLIGPDIVLFSSHLICKAKGDGLAVPWHQDGIYWPLEPMNVVTVWLAIDESTVENGCMRVIPGSHEKGPVEHVEDARPETKVLHMALPDEVVDESRAVDLVLRAGDASFHAPYLHHGSAPNNSSKRRCGFTMRFMPVTTMMRRDGPMAKWFKDHPLFLLRGRDTAGVNVYGDA